MKILVRNLARTTTDEDLLDLFKVYGKVQSCTVVIDKATRISKGFGFVEMPLVGEAKVAIKELNAKDVGGNIIRVKKAETSDTASAAKKPRPDAE
ncbi:MAG: RNA-binding protein [Gammaproteobacteria bacterium]|nr:RNA-binding protein [Gammaproteobacteria bacterium]MBU2479360.1 RNA-binding protein [Gammaproteobacteria bacterium]